MPVRSQSGSFVSRILVLFPMAAILVSLAARRAGAEDRWAVYPAERRDAARSMLRDFLRRESHEALNRRRAHLETLRTPELITEHQQRLRERFRESLGGFPPRTPLNSRVVGRLQGDGYRVEKIVFESRPQFLLTAALYLPQGEPPYPGVLLPCGHSENGKAAGAYQRASILLARNGLAVLCYDPLGQGERKQLLERDADGDRLAKGRFRSTSEHMITGVAPILLGENLATYRIWDGIRGLDYLAGREDIDANRLGCTGNSGGGLMTSYLMALDERVVAAAPGCFITTTRLKNEKPGPGDAEQNVFGQIRDGIDHPDYLILHAPRPALICAATRDFVPIAGTWDAFRQAKRIYTRLGAPEGVSLVEADAPHGFSRLLREAATRWMRRWLLKVDDAVVETDFPIHSDKELQCTPSGQVLLESSRSIYDEMRDRGDALREERTRRWKSLSSEQRRDVVRAIGIRPLEQLPAPKVERVGSLERADCQVQKLILRRDEGIELPALLLEPKDAQGTAVLYVDDRGKQAGLAEDGLVEQFLDAGHPVLAVDVRGLGETATKPWRYTSMAPYVGDNAAEFYIAYMLGRSLVAMRAEDTLVAARFLAERTGQSQVRLVTVGRTGVAGLHAAACRPELFSTLERHRPLVSWHSVLETPVTRDQLENTVHGALRHYDLPDLLELYGKKVETFDPRDAAGEPVRP